jgi:peptidoglycan hydrolase CwlO-like protein
VGHTIDVSGGAANINIDSTLTGVNQVIGSSNSLDGPQKAELEQMVAALTAELAKLKQDNADEKAAIETALKAAIAAAAKPPAERKKSILELSAKGLKDAADLVKDIAPAVISTAGLIAKFILGL